MIIQFETNENELNFLLHVLDEARKTLPINKIEGCLFWFRKIEDAGKAAINKSLQEESNNV